MKVILVTILISGSILILAFTSRPVDDKSEIVKETLAFVNQQAESFAATTMKLEQAVSLINTNNEASIANAKEALVNARIQYKTIEFFMEYFLASSSVIYNAPPKYEVEEPFMEFSEPQGLQVMEAMLFSADPYAKKKALADQAMLVRSSAEDIKALFYNLHVDDKQVLESVRIELIRIITLGITGYDAPQLKSGIRESAAAMLAVKSILSFFLTTQTAASDSLKIYLDASIQRLSANPDFNSFNRMDLLINALLPLQEQLGFFIQER
jgi:cytochrome c peroxidase